MRSYLKVPSKGLIKVSESSLMVSGTVTVSLYDPKY